MTRLPNGHFAPPGAAELYEQHALAICRHTDRLFAWLMLVQWLAAIAAAYWISPRAWAGSVSTVHLHVWAAIFLGGAVSLFPIALAVLRPGRASTRYVIATAQMLMSSLLIHFTGGRIETHFHVFGSLAFLSFYRDWRVLVPATIVVAADHFLRGVFWPESVFGVLTPSHWRWLEHAGWVVFEDIFLIGSCRRAQKEMWSIAERTAELHASQERYRAIVDRAEGVFLADAATGVVLECNAAFRTLLGLDNEAARSVTLSEFDAGSREELDAAIGRLLRGKLPIQLERRYRRTDGSPIDVTLNLSVLAHGRMDVLCGAVRDITASKASEEALRVSEEQLRQSQKMEAVGQLAGGVAHDFNNLLSAILGYAELASEQLGKGHRVQADIAEITRAGQSAAALTRQLLTFSRKQVVLREVLDLNAVLSSVDKMLRRLIGEQIELVTTLEPHLRCVEADAGQIEQVIVNLAVNARSAMSQGGRLELQTANVEIAPGARGSRFGLPPGAYVMLLVSDTGCGMDASVQARIFEPFFTTKPPGEGTGLGLSTTYGIVKQSGGSIVVDSAPGQGSTFRIFLPAVERPARHAAAGETGAVPRRPTETLLIVEDDSVVRVLTRRMLERAGYIVLEASSPHEALRIAERHAGTIELILTDIVMPQMSGPALADRLWVLRPDARVLFMSGYTDDALASHDAGERSLAYLAKPFTSAALIERIGEVLNSPASDRSAYAGA